jgi:hypothetical protein
MPHERQRAVPGADQRKAGESRPRYTGSSVLNRPASPAGADLVLFLQRAAGNRAATRLLQRFPVATDIESFWSELVAELKKQGLTTKDIDCFQASMRVGAIGRSKARDRKLNPQRPPLDGPLYRISKHDERATPEEARAAHGRGWRVRDHVVSFGRREYLKVHMGGAGGAAPTAAFYPLLPGTIIYTAENAGWADRASGTYNWLKRHAAVYRSGGWVRDNFATQPRNIMEGHAEEDDWGAWRMPEHPEKDDPQFLTTLAIYDPFYAYRSEAEVLWLSRGPRNAWSAAFGR